MRTSGIALEACPRCGHESPLDARFCMHCGALLARSCAGCGEALPAEVRFCPSCGRAMEDAAPSPPPTRDLRAYTPKHLAEKILATRSALEGERKQVTVLFADVKGSMELAEQTGPEAWHAILDCFFQILTDGVHRFEGTVNQYTGDGIMALFGAPIAHEDHAQRACYAALHLQQELRPYADEIRLQHGLGFSVRMGLNSGTWLQLPRIELDVSCANAAAAHDHARCALETGEKSATPQARMVGLIALGIAHRLNSQWDESVAVLEEAVRATISGANSMLEGWVRAELAEALLGRGDLDRAEHEAQAAATVAHAQHSRCDEVRAHLALAHTQLRRADAAALARAEQALVRAQELIDETSAHAYQPEVHECRAHLARLRGDPLAAQREIAEARRLYAEMGATAQVERLAKQVRP